MAITTPNCKSVQEYYSWNLLLTIYSLIGAHPKYLRIAITSANLTEYFRQAFHTLWRS